jgi:hypothetical protein
MQTYTIAIVEKDPLKARELRSMLRNFHRLNGGRGEVMPNLFEVGLQPAHRKQVDVTAQQLGAALQFIDIGAVRPITRVEWAAAALA